MRSRSQHIVAALGVATILQLPATAFAMNLTGEWSGTISCTAFDGTLYRIPRSPSTLYVSHSGSTFAAHLDNGEGPTDYSGQAIQESGLSTRLRAIMVECHTAPTLVDRSEVVHLKAADGGGGGRIKGSSIFRGQSGDIGTCRWTFTRVNKTDPGLADCP
jgi:hypothetical protein